MNRLEDKLHTLVSTLYQRARRDQRFFARNKRSCGHHMVEVLEARTLLSSTFVVDSTGDFSSPNDGVTTLREAVLAANASPGHDTIIFSPLLTGQTVFVTQSTGIGITDDLTITGLGADVLAISRGGLANAGILRSRDGASLHLSGVTLTNAPTGGFGSQALVTEGDTTIVDVTFRDNRNEPIRHGTGHLQIESSRFIDNVGTFGGAISISGLGIPTATIVNSLFQNNHSHENGGAIRSASANVTIVGSLFEGNTATGSGGAIYSVANIHGAGGDVNLINSTLTGNTADGFGGGIYITFLNELSVTNSTIAFNRADADGDGFGTGGGIALVSSSTGSLFNAIVAGNMTGLTVSPNDLFAQVFTEFTSDSSHNLIGDAASSGGLVNGVNGNIVGANVTDVLEPLADNGGLTPTHAIKTGSAAHDAGDISLIPPDTLDFDGDGDTSEPIPFDQRGPGFDRIAGSAVDIGAFEINNQPPVLKPDQISDVFQLDVFYSDGGIISGPLFGDLTSLPPEVAASFVIDASSGGTTFGLSDVVSALATFADGVWDDTLLDSFQLQIDPVSGNVTDLTYQFRSIDIVAADGIILHNFPLTVSGTDTASGQPFEYRYTESTELTAVAIDVAENQTFVFDFDSADPEEETEGGGGLTYSLTGGADQGLFSIDADTGVLTFSTAPDFENPGDAGGDNSYHVQVSVTDSGVLSASQDIAVLVTNVNEAPTVSGPIVVTTNEDAVAFSVNLLAGASDVDTDDMLNVANLMLTGGDDSGVTVNGNSLDIDPSAYNHLAVGQTEVVSYTYDVEDGNGGSVPQTATITIEGRNDAPAGADFSKTGTEDSPVTLSAADFIGNFSDPDTSDTLAEVRIDALPANGVLQLNGAAVTAGQVIAVADLDSLVFVPDVNFNGETSFTYSAGDGIAFSVAPATVTLDILSAAEQVALIDAKIDELFVAGVINEGQAESLKLALKDNNGDIGKVGAFLNEVEGYINGGMLTPEQAQDLIEYGLLLLQSLETP